MRISTEVNDDDDDWLRLSREVSTSCRLYFIINRPIDMQERRCFLVSDENKSYWFFVISLKLILLVCSCVIFIVFITFADRVLMIKRNLSVYPTCEMPLTEEHRTPWHLLIIKLRDTNIHSILALINIHPFWCVFLLSRRQDENHFYQQ